MTNQHEKFIFPENLIVSFSLFLIFFIKQSLELITKRNYHRVRTTKISSTEARVCGQRGKR